VVGYTALVVALVSPLHAVGEGSSRAHGPAPAAEPGRRAAVASCRTRCRSCCGRCRGRSSDPCRLVAGPGCRAMLRRLTHPLVACVAVCRDPVVVHQPIAYQWALENRGRTTSSTSASRHAVLFWWPVIGAPPLRSALSYPARLAYTFLPGANSFLAPASPCRGHRLYPFYVTAAMARTTPVSTSNWPA